MFKKVDVSKWDKNKTYKENKHRVHLPPEEVRVIIYDEDFDHYFVGWFSIFPSDHEHAGMPCAYNDLNNKIYDDTGITALHWDNFDKTFKKKGNV